MSAQTKLGACGPYISDSVVVYEGTKVVQPLFLGQLIRFFTPNSTVSLRDAYLFAMGVSLCAVVLAVTHHPYFFSVQRIGMKLRVAACSLLYRKALRLSNTALGQTTTGQIVNLMSNDAAIFIHYLWVGPLQAIPVLIILWIELGPSTLAGFGVLLLLVPVQSWMGKLFSKLRHKTAVHTDERVKVMNEIISGMRVIKMYCWEKPFGDLVGKIRSLLVQISGLIFSLMFGSASKHPLLVFVVQENPKENREANHVNKAKESQEENHINEVRATLVAMRINATEF
ncbi:hypothetical protein KUTeg_011852 [Tegillarca granosa]|uniref:ABC transmembrane type-1 domain-containing protein n=1 Tax=Tegillarca granosa TaxID=220873 RepID=A0ABQ9F279_TEGGR|nr:hypothetical protein KUTeg_011852 [Tegillarca granosa]